MDLLVTYKSMGYPNRCASCQSRSDPMIYDGNTITAKLRRGPYQRVRTTGKFCRTVKLALHWTADLTAKFKIGVVVTDRGRVTRALVRHRSWSDTVPHTSSGLGLPCHHGINQSVRVMPDSSDPPIYECITIAANLRSGLYQR